MRFKNFILTLTDLNLFQNLFIRGQKEKINNSGICSDTITTLNILAANMGTNNLYNIGR